MVGVAVTVKADPLLATPPTVTTTLPVVAPAGTTATIDVALQLVIEVAVVPLNFTVLVPCVAPKLEPLIVTELPTDPEVRERVAIEGVEVIVTLPVALLPSANVATNVNAVPLANIAF